MVFTLDTSGSTYPLRSATSESALSHDISDTLSEEDKRSREVHLSRLAHDPLYRELRVIRGTLEKHKRHSTTMLKHSVHSPIHNRYPSLARQPSMSEENENKPTMETDTTPRKYTGGLVMPTNRKHFTSGSSYTPHIKTKPFRHQRVNKKQMCIIAFILLFLLFILSLTVGILIYSSIPSRTWSCFPSSIQPTNHRSCDVTYANLRSLFHGCEEEYDEWEVEKIEEVIGGYLRENQGEVEVVGCEEKIGSTVVPYWYPESHRAPLRTACSTKCEEQFTSAMTDREYTRVLNHDQLWYGHGGHADHTVQMICDELSTRQSCIALCNVPVETFGFSLQLEQRCSASSRMYQRKEKEIPPTARMAEPLPSSVVPRQTTVPRRTTAPQRPYSPGTSCVDRVENYKCDRRCSAETKVGGSNDWCELAQCVISCITQLVTDCEKVAGSRVREVYRQMLLKSEKTKHCDI